MAEIKIRKKSPIWPWILLILIVLVTLWYFFIYLDNNDLNETDDVDDTTTEQIDDESYNPDENDVNNETYMAQDSSYNLNSANNSLAETTSSITIADANKSIIDLVDATRSKAIATGVKISNDLKAQREKLVKVTPATTDKTWMPMLKESGNQIIAALQNIQQEKYPQLSNEVTNAQNSLQMIDASASFEDQKANIDTFIRNVVNTLNKMQ